MDGLWYCDGLRMDGWKDGMMVGCFGWLDGHMVGWLDGCMDGSLNDWRERWLNGWME